ncbi:13967_t:CDS:2 [Cetraspora pellucida]|uniref:13967_t:CDS:1 n=1 Tax=Cetraspora pellucida TaxID=1433469 RepID=A0A9N9N374_9GLOM|nr:13967_t:CDS:2 [Cetraspora pellucida]
MSHGVFGCKTFAVFKIFWFCHSSCILKEVLRTITLRIDKIMQNFSIVEILDIILDVEILDVILDVNNSSQFSQGFLLLDYSQDKLQEDLINVKDMISLDDEKEYENNPIFNLKQSLYKESAKGLQKLIGVWKIDKDAANNVNKELYYFDVCLRHFNYDQNTVYSKNLKDKCLTEKSKADPECTAMHLGDTKTTLLYFAKLIEIVAYSENNIIKKNILQNLISCIENFNLDLSSASSSKLLSLFVVNTILKIKKIDFSKQQLIQKSKKYKEFRKSLALEVLKLHTSLAYYKSILESPDSLQQYYEVIPKCLTSLFDSLIHTLLFQKYKIVRQKQKECKSIITEFDKSEIVKSTAYLSSIILTTFEMPNINIAPLASDVELCRKNPFVEKWLMTEYLIEFTIDEINIALKEAVESRCKTSPNVIILEAGPAPNSNLAVHKTCKIYIEDLNLNQEDSLDIAYNKLVNTLYKAITSNEPKKHPLFEISSQLTSAEYECIFNYYNKKLVRITRIIKQDILKIEKCDTRGQRSKDLVPYYIEKKAAKSKK